MTAPRLLLSFLILFVPACHLEEREPLGSIRQGDEQAIEAVVLDVYTAMSAQDTMALDSLLMPGATVALATLGEGYLLPSHVLLEAEAPRSAESAGRVVRTDIRLDGDLATVRVVAAARPAGAIAESEVSDLLTLLRRGGSWRVAHVLFGGSRGRSAS